MKNSPQSKLLSITQGRQLSQQKMATRQQEVYQHLLRNSDVISSGNFSKLATGDLGMLFHAIDERFFDGVVATVCEKVSAKPLKFRLSTRMTTSGGMTTMQRTNGFRPKTEFEIAIATTPLFETFKIDSTAKVGGLCCHDRLEALQRIMEHEMIHLVEMLLWQDSNCSAYQFRNIIKRFFGHRESNHQLLTPRDVARTKLGISVGDWVGFDVANETLLGFVNRISKRATILVECKTGIAYSDGKRYKKYYVPIHRLSPSKRNIA